MSRRRAARGPAESRRPIDALEEMAAHAVIEGHHPRDCVRVAENWAANARRAAKAAEHRKIKGTRNV